MKGFAMLRIGEVGWVEKPRPVCGPLDAVCRPLAAAVCTSDVHTVWEGAVGDRHDLILGHECCAEVVEVGALVKDFRPGDRVLVPAITPDWSSLEAQAGYAMHSGGMLAGWKFSNIKDGVFAEYTTLTAIWRICRRAWTFWKPVCSRTWCRPAFTARSWRTCSSAIQCSWSVSARSD